MASNEAKSEVKLGFFVGVGLVALMLVLMVLQYVLGKLKSSTGGG